MTSEKSIEKTQSDNTTGLNVYQVKKGPIEQEIPDFQTYNPLYNFKLIRGNFLCDPISASSENGQEVNKKTGETEIELIIAWRMHYLDELGNIHKMEHSQINGETLRPEFLSMVKSFHNEFIAFSKSLLSSVDITQLNFKIRTINTGQI